MENDGGNSGNERVTIEIAKKLASDGKYNDAYTLLHPLLHSQYALEVSLLIAKIYAQNKDFVNAEKYFYFALQIDEHNLEALQGLKKCRELKDSKFKTFLSFNKLKIISLAIIVLAIFLLAFSFNALASGNHVYSDGITFADADLIVVSFETHGNLQNNLSALKNLNSSDSQVNMVDNNGVVNVTCDKAKINDVLSVLNSSGIAIDEVAFTLSENSRSKASIDAYNAAIDNSNSTNNKNVTTVVVPNTLSFKSNDYSSQLNNLYYMLNNDDLIKVKVVSVIETS